MFGGGHPLPRMAATETQLGPGYHGERPSCSKPAVAPWCLGVLPCQTLSGGTVTLGTGAVLIPRSAPGGVPGAPKAPCDGGKAPALRAGGPKRTVWVAAPLCWGLSGAPLLPLLPPRTQTLAGRLEGSAGVTRGWQRPSRAQGEDGHRAASGAKNTQRGTHAPQCRGRC